MRKFFLGLILSFGVTPLLAEEGKVLYPGATGEGFYAGIQSGMLFYSGTDRSLYRDGALVGLKVGYSLFRWLSLETMFKFSGHNTTLGSQRVGAPKSFGVYQTLAQVKGGIPLWNRWQIGAGAGGGFFISSPNQRATAGTSSRVMGYGEINVEYFLRTRGLSLSIDPSLALVRDLKGPVIQFTGSLRYIF